MSTTRESVAPPAVIDLFAGAGGLGEGLQAAGFSVAAAVELHPQAALTYAFNHPQAAVLVGDIRELPLTVLEGKVRERTQGTVELVVGGPPCQGFSTAGRKQATDPRNDLFQQFVRVVEHFRPRAFLMENVPGFRTMYGGRTYRAAAQAFTELGYQFVDTVLDASAHGLPQRRQRFVMVGYRPGSADSFRWPQSTHFGSAQGSLLSEEAGYAPFVTSQEAIGDLAFLEPGWEGHRYQGEATSEYQAERRKDGDYLFNHLATRHREKAERMFAHIKPGGSIRTVPPDLRTAKRTMVRLHADCISNAVVSLPDDLLHYGHHRILTVRETARLQGFDDGYVFLGKRTSCNTQRRLDLPQYTQVGNAVPPLLAKELGKALLSTCLGGVVRDARDLEARRSRHDWVRGSSGFNGYVLDPVAEAAIELTDVHGVALPLPLADRELRVGELDPVYEWAAKRSTIRPQWAPGVKGSPGPRYVGSHQEEGRDEQ